MAGFLSLFPIVSLFNYFLYKNISHSLLNFLLIISIVYIVYFGLIAKGDWAIYAYLILWCFIPKSIRLLPGLGIVEDVSGGIFAIIEAVALLTILVAVFRRGQGWRTIEAPRRLKIFFLLFVITFLFSNFFSLIFRDMGYFPDVSIEGAEAFGLFMEIPYALIFLYGVMIFIKERQQVEKIFFIIMLGGINIGVQAIVLWYLNLFPFFKFWAMSEKGYFSSLTFLGYNAVGLFCLISICCSMYLYLSKVWKTLACSAIFLNFLSIIATLERAPLGAAFLSLCIIGWFYTKGSLQRALALSGIAVICFSTLFFEPAALMDKAAAFLGAGIRGEYGTIDFSSRIMLGTKGLNVFLFSWPFGVGSGLVQFFIAQDITQGYIFVPSQTVSDSHNAFISHIAEYGLLGIVTLFLFVSAIFRNFRVWRERLQSVKIDKKKWSAMICVYAAFGGCAFYYFFENNPKFSHVLLMLFYFTFLTVSFLRVEEAQKMPESVAGVMTKGP